MNLQSQTNCFSGGCLCNAVTFEILGSIPKPDACHCEKCRKWSGHFLVSSDIRRKNLLLKTTEKLRWFRSSEKVRRGFCMDCGSSLFFDPLNTQKHDWIGVALGAIRGPTKTSLGKHIFVGDKADYYQIDDGLPQEG